MADIVRFPGLTRADEPPEGVLEKAKAWGLSTVMIVGYDEKGDFRFGGSTSDAHLMNWLLDEAKAFLHENAGA